LKPVRKSGERDTAASPDAIRPKEEIVKLFEPIEIRGMRLKNRLYMASMVAVGLKGPNAIEFYVERAKGGVGAITTQYVTEWKWVLEEVDELRPLTDAVHEAAPDCRIALQPGPVIHDEGTWPMPAGMTSPSGLYPKATHVAMTEGIFDIPFKPREMSKEEIRWCVETMAKAVVNQKRVGFDYVEFHGSHGYLLRQFFSPIDNQRTDEYGGSLENRMRFALETVRASRAAVGDDFPIFYKLPAIEGDFGGITLDESCRFAIELEKAGVDALAVTIGVNSHPRGYRNAVVPLYSEFPRGSFVDYAGEVKKWVDIPIIAIGRITEPAQAEEILASGKADMIGMGRTLIADADWPNKAATGRWGEIRPCLSCNCCLDHHFPGSNLAGLRCAINPYAALEDQLQITPAEKKKKVLVVGGGPAGMEAAKTAAERGHDVTLCEQSESLGGMLIPASKPPHKEDLEKLRQYQSMELMRTGVKINRGQSVDEVYVKSLKPDAVILATGAQPTTLNIPGADNANVFDAVDVLNGKPVQVDRVAVIGGGLVGCETAEYLTAQGKRVVIVEMLDEMGADIFLTTRSAIVQKLKEMAILTETGAKAVEFNQEGVVVERAGQRETIPAQAVVLAVGLEPVENLSQRLEGQVDEIHVVGDCADARRIRDAIHEGARAGREV
jgi:2,4-dienoyl-CoA reductase-like NADH-dependent reductase (Old Yellow Enzyme family)/thioredoxin reductase